MNRFISLGEVRLSVRLIAKQPILSITIILALATGIGFATMGFTVRDAAINSVLPFAGGERFSQLTAFDRDGGRIAVDLARFHTFLERSTKLDHVGAVGSRPFTITHDNGEVESIRGALITPRSMRVLPASPLI